MLWKFFGAINLLLLILTVSAMPAPIELVEDDDSAGVIIQDPTLTINKIIFTKTGTPDYQIEHIDVTLEHIDVMLEHIDVILVKLSLFAATTSEDGVVLRWRTEAEIDNAGFIVYRSVIKNDSYTKIGFVDAAEDSEASNNYQFIDKKVKPGKTYFYYLEDIDLAGKKNKSEIVKVSTPLAKIGSMRSSPKRFRLLQNYPNPFNPETWIPFELPRNAPVTINIYDTKGQLIRTISLGTKGPAVYASKYKAAYWDGRNNLGEKVPSGLYFYTLRADSFTATRKMILLK